MPPNSRQAWMATSSWRRRQSWPPSRSWPKPLAPLGAHSIVQLKRPSTWRLSLAAMPRHTRCSSARRWKTRKKVWLLSNAPAHSPPNRSKKSRRSSLKPATAPRPSIKSSRPSKRRSVDPPVPRQAAWQRSRFRLAKCSKRSASRCRRSFPNSPPMWQR